MRPEITIRPTLAGACPASTRRLTRTARIARTMPTVPVVRILGEAGNTDRTDRTDRIGARARAGSTVGAGCTAAERDAAAPAPAEGARKERETPRESLFMPFTHVLLG